MTAWPDGAVVRARLVVAALVLVLVAGLLVVGAVVWQRAHRTDLEEALDAVPASSLRVGFTDWAVVRTQAARRPRATPRRARRSRS